MRPVFGARLVGGQSWYTGFRYMGSSAYEFAVWGGPSGKGISTGISGRHGQDTIDQKKADAVGHDFARA